MAYRHAWRMTHFQQSGHATPSPSDLATLEKIATLLVGVELPRPRNTSTPQAVGLPFETVLFPAADGLMLEGWWVQSSRATDVAILFHGYGASRQSLLGEARELWDLGFGVLLVDLRGAGGSQGSVTTLGWQEAGDVAGAVRFAEQHLAPERLLLFGASMGAVAILRAVHEHGLEPDALILEAPFNSLLDTISNRFHQMGLPAFPCAHLLAFWGGRQHGFDAFAHEPQVYLESVTQPTLLLLGNADPDVTAADALALRRHAPGAVMALTFPGAGHPRLFPQQPERWRRAVDAFVERALGPRPPRPDQDPAQEAGVVGHEQE